MANQLYGYVLGDRGGPGALSSSQLGSTNPYLRGSSLMSPSWNPTQDPLPALVDSFKSKYPVMEKYSSLYLNQITALRPPDAGGAVHGSYPGQAACGENPMRLRFAGAVEPSLLPGMKRPSEALYHQTTILEDLNSIGQNEALFSTNAFVKRPRNDNVSHLPVYPQRQGEKYCHQYMWTRTCVYRDNCKYHHPVWVPEGGIPNWDEGPCVVAPEFLPQRPGQPDCPFFRCKFGLKCKFNHPKNKASEMNDVSIMPPSLLHNTKGLPIRPGEQDCPFYLKTGSCKYGGLCRYNHPEINANNPPVAAAFGHAVISSSATNLSNRVIDPAGAPLNVNPRYAQTAVGVSPTVYPQRPGQTECDFYMKTGSCKFDERCKFHHPIDRSASTPSVGKQTVQQDVKLTLAGLPRRAGLLFCRDYMDTGCCVYGAACKYDHPPPAEAIARTAVPGSTFGPGAAAAVEKEAKRKKK